MSPNIVSAPAFRGSTRAAANEKRLTWIVGAIGAVAAIGSTVAWLNWPVSGSSKWIVSGNGRIEATPIDIASKTPGRIDSIVVREGELVDAGQVVAIMDNRDFDAQLAKARALADEAQGTYEAALAVVAERKSALAIVQSALVERRSDLELARRSFTRSNELFTEGSIPRQAFDVDETHYTSMRAAVEGAQTSVVEAQSAVAVARAQADQAFAAHEAALAEVLRLATVIEDNYLKSPCRGRVQYHVAQTGEVVGAGATIVNLIDLTDIYMTFFLPERAAGSVSVGDEARIILDALPNQPLPAHVSYIASVAQFTPKTVETAAEREKLMFRVKARIDTDASKLAIDQLKTGVPGVAYARLDRGAAWPRQLNTIDTIHHGDSK